MTVKVIEQGTIGERRFRFGFCDTPDELLAAQQLRYTVFTLEEGDERYADHERGTFSDDRDGPSANVLIALDETDTCVATLRFSLRREGPFIGDDAYPYEELSEALGLPVDQVLFCAALVERGVVKKEFRRSGVFREMYAFGERWLQKEGIRVVLGAVMESKPDAARVQEKFGYQLVGRCKRSEWLTWLIYGKDLSHTEQSSHMG